METGNIVFLSAEVVVGVISVLGNLLVFIAICRTHQLHTATNVFVGNLAIADIAVGLYIGPLTYLNLVGLPHHFYGCLILNSALLIFLNVSIFMLMVIAIERFIAIKNPFAYHQSFTILRAFAVNMIVWILAILTGMIPVYGWHTGVREIDFCDFMAVIPMEYLVYFHTSFFLVVPLLIMFALYGYIFAIVRRHRKYSETIIRSIQHNQPGGSDGLLTVQDKQEEKRGKLSRRLFHKDVRAAKWFTLVITVFTISWVPLSVCNLLYLVTDYGLHIDVDFINFTVVLSHANSMVNPFLYAMSNPQIKAAMWRTLGYNVPMEQWDSSYSNTRLNTSHASPYQNASYERVFLPTKDSHGTDITIQSVGTPVDRKAYKIGNNNVVGINKVISNLES